MLIDGVNVEYPDSLDKLVVALCADFKRRDDAVKDDNYVTRILGRGNILNITAALAVAEAMGVGAIVFYYLTNNRIKDINFSLEEALSFEGNTGPYVQYTYARACSVLNRAGNVADVPVQITTEEEAALVKTLCRFGERVCSAIADYEPSNITRFILDVAAAFNRFYHDCPILSAEDENMKKLRLALTVATKTVLGNAFGLICLQKTEKI